MKAVLLTIGLASTIGLSLLGIRLADAMPQVTKGEGVLSVAFGDARETISRAMVHKADSYFHGGVDMECSEAHDHHCEDPDCHHDHHDGGAEDQGDHSDHHHDDGSVPESNNSFPDPWRWINSHIRAPEVERHLEGERAVELMPWFWAAVKADPHNIDAWTTAIYMAMQTMKDDVLARKVIDEAKRANPDSLEILLNEGKFVYKHGTGDVETAKGIFTQVRDRALSRCAGNVDDLSENDRWMYKFALSYLTDIGKRK